MAIFSDLELQRIMNEDHVAFSIDTRETDSKIKKQIQDRTGQMKDLAAKATANAKSNIWINKKKADDSSKGKKKITFKEDANGNIIDCTLEGEEYFEEGKNASTAKQLEKKADDMRRDLTNSTAIELEKEKQSWREKPAEKALTTAADIATGGGVIRSGAKFLGKGVDKGIKSAQHIIKQQEKKRKAANEAVDWRDIYRSE